MRISDWSSDVCSSDLKPNGHRGVYMWGGVGRGKSMLMDLAFETIDISPKRRVHFHEFMIEVHDRLRVERAKESGDPNAPVGEAIPAEAKLTRSEERLVGTGWVSMCSSRRWRHY